MNRSLPSVHLIQGVVLAIGAAYALTSAAVHTGVPDTAPTVVPGNTVTWGAAPPSLPPGAQASVLLGSPSKEGPFVLRLKFPAGFVVPPHRHSKDEMVTIISGQFGIVAGDKIDRSAFKALPPASFVHLPAGVSHYAIAETESIVQINGVGPFDVSYINPKDDPRTQ
jgi:quercetin dioxygenase-like cupin family protein